MRNSSRSLIVFAAILAVAASVAFEPGAGFAATYTLAPTDDAFAWERYPTAVTGSYNWLSADWDSGTGYQGRSYFKFNLGGIGAGEAIVAAALRVYMYQAYNPGFFVALNHVAADGWSEGSLTWNNQPGYGSQLARVTASAPQWGAWDLFADSAWDPAADRSDGYLSLVLKHETEAGAGSYAVSLLSKEWTIDPSLRPCLLIETSVVPLPPSILLFGSGLLGTIFIARRRSGRQAGSARER